MMCGIVFTEKGMYPKNYLLVKEKEKEVKKIMAFLDHLIFYRLVRFLRPAGYYTISYPGRRYDLRRIFFSTVPGQEGGKSISGHGILTWLDKDVERCLTKVDREEIEKKPLWIFKEVFGEKGEAIFWGETEISVEGISVSSLKLEGDRLVHRWLPLYLKFGGNRPILKYPVS